MVPVGSVHVVRLRRFDPLDAIRQREQRHGSVLQCARVTGGVDGDHVYGGAHVRALPGAIPHG